MNLVRAEVDRLAARRFVRLMLVLLAVAFGITIATTLAGSHRATAFEITVAEKQAAQAKWENDAFYQQCLQARQGGELPDYQRDKFPMDCEQVKMGQPDPADFLYGVFVFERQIQPLAYFLIAFLALFGFLVGASYIGADLTSGGMTNLLLWRPQRMKVLGTKLATLLGAVAVISVLASLVYLGAFWVIAQVRGLPGDLDAAFWRDLSGTVGRGLGLVLLGTALGFAIATLGRHTAAAMGALAAYAVVWEGGARIVMEIVETARPEQWMLSSYLGAWAAGSARFFDRAACNGTSGLCDPMYTITWPVGLAVLLVLVGGLAAAAFATFNRRDLA